MTIEWPRIGEGWGQLSDSKPTKPQGYTIYEWDTGDKFWSDGTFWWLLGRPGPNSKKKIGSYPAGTSGVNGDGIFQTLTAPTGVGSQNFLSDTTNGSSLTCISGAVSGNKGGLYLNSARFTRGFNLRMKIRFKFNTNVNLTFTNAYIGFLGGAPTVQPTGTDPFGTGAAVPGCTFGINTTVATNFVVAHNDTSGSTVLDNTSIPFDNNIHTLYMVCDNANAKIWWALDNFNYTPISTDIPSSVNTLSVGATLETEEAVAKSFQLYEWLLQSDL